MTVTRAKWTVEDYHRMIAAGILDDCRVELLQGEIVEMAIAGEPHAFRKIPTASSSNVKKSQFL